LLARWLHNNPDILILDEPTQGIDVGAKFEIYQLIRQLAEEGKGILLISSEMSELLNLCQRIMVIKEGHCVAVLDADEASEEKILSSAGSVNIQNLLHNIRQPLQQQKVALPTREGYEFTQVNAILYCSAEGAYTKVHLTDKRSMLISRTLGDIEEMLPPEVFVRIHHSTVVNLNAVTHYIRTDGGYVVMNTHEKLMVSKARKDVLLERLGLK